jgi:MFS family permease
MGRLLPQIYYNAVFGGIGGLLGWMLYGEFLPSVTAWDWQLALAGGALIGAMIGYFVVAVDALLDRVVIRFVRHASYGVLLGALGGAAGYFVGDWANYALMPEAGDDSAFLLVGRVLARAFGWMLFGLAIGLSEGIAAWSMRKLYYGTIGGCLGGLIGGAVFGWLMEHLNKDAASYTVGQAVGLVVLGACIGALTALVAEVLKPAAVRVLRGWQEGREYPIIKNETLLGRAEAADVLLLRDMTVEKQHAYIRRQGNRFFLENNQAPPKHTLVNGEAVDLTRELHDGDRIQLGQIVLQFALRAARVAPHQNGKGNKG